MRFITVAALFSSVVLATSDVSAALPNSLPELFSRIPACANKCVADAMPGLCPSVESYWCRCHNSVKGRLMSKTFDCAMEACGGMQQALEYQEATNSVCDDIMDVTIKSQKHVELRQAGSVGSAAPSGSVAAGSVKPSGSTGRRGASARGSGSGSAGVATISAATSTPAAATGAAPSVVAPSALASLILGSGVAGLAVISVFGMLI